jgi:glycosyltransferase involved in cell wall biosynthesis
MISVIVAAYNCGGYIARALESVFSQTLPGEGYEIVAVNDGSTDDTLDVLNRYRDKIKLVSQPNRGLAAACNRGIEESAGDYIMRLDADDYLDPRMLAATLKALEGKPAYHCVYTDRYEVGARDNTKVRVSVGQDNVFDMVGCGLLFRRQVFDQIGQYRDLLFEEYDLMLRFYEGGLKSYYLPEPLYYYLKRESGMTSQQNYWPDGWRQLVDIWGEEKLQKYIDIQAKVKGKSRFPIAIRKK